jgi:hypothetical protein
MSKRDLICASAARNPWYARLDGVVEHISVASLEAELKFGPTTPDNVPAPLAMVVERRRRGWLSEWAV